jgi:hypothetical protein
MVAPGIEPGTIGSLARKSDHYTTETVEVFVTELDLSRHLLVHLFMFYLTILLIAPFTWRRIVEWSVNNELKRMWKVAVMVQF